MVGFSKGKLNGISLFSGIGGIELGLHEEVKTVAYVEREPYAQAVLIKRMQEGILDNAPIYDDVCTFRGKKYRGFVDIVFGGFPCQDISFAGKGAGIKEGTRSGLFFELMRVVGEVRPAFVFLENVSAITTRGVDAVLGALAEAGYNARWLTIRASDVGARHRRDRWFCLAYTKSASERSLRRRELAGRAELSEASIRENNVADTQKYGDKRECGTMGEAKAESECEDDGAELNGESKTERMWKTDPADFEPASESFVGRVANGIPKRLDRLKCIGNAVVPQQCGKAWEILTNTIGVYDGRVL